MDVIQLTGIRSYGYTGYLAEEQILGQWFEVDLRLGIDLARAGQSDRIEDTLDYRSVIATVKEIIATQKFALVEKLAETLVQAILQHDLVQQVELKLHKPAAPIPDFGGKITSNSSALSLSWPMKGKLIVFEGVEGSGKSTQVAHAYEWLRQSGWQKKPIIKTRQPGGTALGAAIRQLLLSEEDDYPLHDRSELLLYAADRSQHLAEIVQPQLDLGGLVLCDRFTDSTIAYQGYGRGLDILLIEQINCLATAGLESDLTIWLDVDVEIGLARVRQRGQIDRMEKNELAFHRRVQQGYQELATANPQRIWRIDANQAEAEVQAQIQEILYQHLAEKSPERTPQS